MPVEEHKEEIAIVERAAVEAMNPDESLSGSARANPAVPAADGADGADEAARGSLGGQQNGEGDDSSSQSSEGSIPELSSSTARIPEPRFQLRRQPSGTYGRPPFFVCVCAYERVGCAAHEPADVKLA